MYDKYFYSKNVDKGLLSSEYRTETIESYMFRIINLHNKNRQLSSLKGLKSIYEAIDLSNIQRGFCRDTNDAFNRACDVMSLILMNIDPIKVQDDSQSQNGDEDSENDDSQEGNGSGEGNTISDEELQDMLDSDSIAPSENLSNDDGSDSVELSERQKSMLKKHFEKQEKFLDGDVQKTKLNKKESQDIQSIEESGATYENVGKDIPKNWYDGTGKGTKCLVVKKLTQSLIDSDQFSCASSWNQRNYNDKDRYRRDYNFVEEGLRLGSMLGRKLQVRGEESQLKFSRQDSGKIDKRLIAELGFGNSNVFSHTLTERYNKAYLHISVDASGSMCGKKWNKAMTSAVAMIKACDMAGNIDVVVSIRTTHSSNSGGTDVPLILVAYDSRVDKLIKVKNLFGALDVSGTTPEGLCFEAIQKDLIPGNSNQDSYFINFSDGQPYYGNSDISYSGENAERHTRKMVGNMKAMGISVLSYFIGGSYESERDNVAFTNMYGKDAEFINATNMMSVAKTMNKKFLSK
jgi:nitric oxide reductase activation protein